MPLHLQPRQTLTRAVYHPPVPRRRSYRNSTPCTWRPGTSIRSRTWSQRRRCYRRRYPRRRNCGTWIRAYTATTGYTTTLGTRTNISGRISRTRCQCTRQIEQTTFLKSVVRVKKFLKKPGFEGRWTRSWSGRKSKGRSWRTKIRISITRTSVKCSVSLSDV